MMLRVRSRTRLGRGDEKLRRAAAHAHRSDHRRLRQAQKYNTVIAKLMEISNSVREAAAAGVTVPPSVKRIDSLLLMLAPICPFITEESVEPVGPTRLDPSAAVRRSPTRPCWSRRRTTIVVQVNGKIRGPAHGCGRVGRRRDRTSLAATTIVAAALADVSVKNVFHVQDRLLNFVV